ncbi:hypothetical protein [Chitinophaga japonensis]|uniref:Uncharacterized protein n=1 Tax=Chitinophaga japonensis TaxID=104662 RepID=A0A562TB98_CHIJA|nr:hypothetical protein [Chitinophaga japonensis]TWI90877.1 hypothetical protein LX66_0237 [Chitinophaga japonensis]
MQRHHFLLLALAAITTLFTACGKDNDQPGTGEYLLVAPNTTSMLSDFRITVYKISAEGSYRATMDQGSSFEGKDLDFTPLTAAQHDSLKNFLFTLPVDSLEASNVKVFGCPGCADGPAWLLGYKAPGEALREWHIDYGAVPAYLQSYLEALYRVTRTME